MSKVNLADLIGKQFGNYTVVSVDSYKKVNCKCGCGRDRTIGATDLINGKSKSCGCQRARYVTESKIKHGMCGHPLNMVYHNMINRCHNPKNKSYSYYGARGITVCDEWRNDNTKFFDWCLSNGWAKGLKLDRRDNNKGYSPNNCRFITHQKNMCNTRKNVLIEYKGEFKLLGDWCTELGLNPVLMHSRVRGYKMSLEEAITKPVKKKTPKLTKDQRQEIRVLAGTGIPQIKIANMFGLSAGHVSSLISGRNSAL